MFCLRFFYFYFSFSDFPAAKISTKKSSCKYTCKMIQTVLICFLFVLSVCDSTDPRKFPHGFMIGAASSAFQIEGAVNEGGRGESIWDRFVNKKPSPIKDGSTADIAADSYHRYKEDVQLLKNAGFDHYRFSISWVRILPRGEINEINQEGIDYYNKLINELIANNIVPLVTMYHWDHPQVLQDLGGWSNPLMADYFEAYAYILFSNFGDRVKMWITINEPTIIIVGHNTNQLAPGLAINGSGEYLAGHTILRAHAKAYRLYDREFRSKQKGKVGITLSGNYVFPVKNNKEDARAADRANQFNLGWFAHPIYSKEGNYPYIMREVIDKNSIDEKRRRSRLPSFTPQEKEDLLGSSDFFGLNHYTSSRATPMKKFLGNESYTQRDTMVEKIPDPNWKATPQIPLFYNVPTGLRRMLNFIKDNYNNPPVFITENGYGDAGVINDFNRIKFFQGYLSEMLKANHTDNCNVIGYTAWSLLDTFEWNSGFKVKLGLTHVDFKSIDRKRTPKFSYNYFKQILQFRRLPFLARPLQKRKLSKPQNRIDKPCQKNTTGKC